MIHINNTKAIFLDIDGVLNCYNSKSRCGNCLGIDKDKTQILSKIVKTTSADLILTSSWKIGWEPYPHYKQLERQGIYDFYISWSHAKYLNNHLKNKGNLTCKDKTRETDLRNRGQGIKEYLDLHPEYTKWIVLDDEIFEDYSKYNILPHLIKTNPEYGLTEKDADAAITILNL